MTPIPTAISLMLLLFLAAPLHAQSPNPTPPPELKKWDIWIGDWALSGTAKDTPTGPEYKVDWSLHERWILGGFFVQIAAQGARVCIDVSGAHRRANRRTFCSGCF